MPEPQPQLKVPLLATHKPRVKLFTLNLEKDITQIEIFEKTVNSFMDLMDGDKLILQQNSILSARENLIVAIAYLEKRDTTQIRVFGGKN